jgi:hypothetical protein
VEVGLPSWFWVHSPRYECHSGLSCHFFLASLVSRYRNKDEDDEGADYLEQKSKKDRSLRMYQAMERLDFATKSPQEQGKISKDYDDEY